MELKGKKVLVAGLGKTGLALVSLLMEHGAEVLVSDTRERSGLEEQRKAFQGKGLPVVMEGGGHTEAFFNQADLILLSPGIPLDLPALAQARQRGVPVWGELELFSILCQTPVAAVTGTNGKTTTTALLNEMLVASGKKTFLGGNIGRPLTEYLLKGQDLDLVVAEISSFQLDTAWHFSPILGLLLNITEDHLDRYPDFQAYQNSKASLFRNQGEKGMAVLNWDDPIVRSLGERLPGPVFYFSRREKVFPGAYLDPQGILLEMGSRSERYHLNGFSLPGLHNRENALAALLGARLLEASPEAVQRTLQTFKGFGHRLEWVGEVRGVRFYDDSKGTNVGAVVKALEGFSEPVYLIAGGRDKGGDYSPLKPWIQQKCKGLALIGEAQQVMKDQLGALTRTFLARTLEEAVSWSFQQAAPGEVVLLSPACSSFDMFRDYGHRGEVFQKAVKELGRDYPAKEQIAEG